MQRLRDDLDRLKQMIQDLISKGNLSSQEIDVSHKLIRLHDNRNISSVVQALKRSIAQLEQNKADKNTVNHELDKVCVFERKVRSQ